MPMAPMAFQSMATLRIAPGLPWSKVHLSSAEGSDQLGSEQENLLFGFLTQGLTIVQAGLELTT
jgi:hypothetical protein